MKSMAQFQFNLIFCWTWPDNRSDIWKDFPICFLIFHERSSRFKLKRTGNRGRKKKIFETHKQDLRNTLFSKIIFFWMKRNIFRWKNWKPHRKENLFVWCWISKRVSTDLKIHLGQNFRREEPWQRTAKRTVAWDINDFPQRWWWWKWWEITRKMLLRFSTLFKTQAVLKKIVTGFMLNLLWPRTSCYKSQTIQKIGIVSMRRKPFINMMWVTKDMFVGQCGICGTVAMVTLAGFLMKLIWLRALCY